MGWNRKLEAKLAWLCITALSVNAFFAAFWHRATNLDGGGMYLTIISNQHIYTHHGINRIFETALQLPALGLSFLLGTSHMSWVAGALDFTYSFHPIISLIACWKLAGWARRQDFFWMSLVILMVSAWAGQAFHANISNFSVSLYLPILILWLGDEISKRWRIVGLVVLSLAMLFTYEAVIALYLSLGLAALWVGVRSKVRSQRKFHLSLAAFWMVCFFIGIYLLMSIPWSETDNFFPSLKEIDYFMAFALVAFCIFLVCLWSQAKIRTLIIGLLVLLAIYVVEDFIMKIGGWGLNVTNPPIAFHARVWAIPLAFLVSLTFVFLEKRKPKPFLETEKRKSSLVVLALVLTLAGFALDLKQTLIFRDGWNTLNRILNGNAQKGKLGCLRLKRSEFEERFSGTGIAPHNLAPISILMQNSYSPESIYFTTEDRTLQSDKCQLYWSEERGFLLENDERAMLHPGLISLEKIGVRR